jgi:hypothetical protein
MDNIPVVLSPSLFPSYVHDCTSIGLGYSQCRRCTVVRARDVTRLGPACAFKLGLGGASM